MNDFGETWKRRVLEKVQFIEDGLSSILEVVRDNILIVAIS